MRFGSLEKASLWTWAREKLGADACQRIQDSCDSRPDEPCSCGMVLAILVLLVELPA